MQKHTCNNGRATRAFSIPNLSAKEILPELPPPWENVEPLPPLATKDEYRRWCRDKDTTHTFFSLVEGLNPHQRVCSENVAFRVHGIVADYDCHGMSKEDVDRAMSRLGTEFPPTAWNRTFSGGVRVVWLFEVPVFFQSKAVYKKLVERAVRELRLQRILPGLDDCIFKPEQYYCAGAGWTVNPDARVPAAVVYMWYGDALKADKFDRDGAPTIPLEVIAAEVEKQFPGRWEGEFVEGARGVRFWDATADNPTGAQVKATGMAAYTGPTPFLTWEKIFGHEFVQRYLADRYGRPIADMYFDGRCYYRQLADGRWDAMKASQVRNELNTVYDLNAKSEKGWPSEVDIAMNRLEREKRVDGALPFPLIEDPLVEWNGGTYLNVVRCNVVQPSSEPQEWGDFPWIGNYLSNLFVNRENLAVFLAWLQVWLKSVYDGRPRRGQALFIAGPVGTGKTLLSQRIVGRIVGGFADAKPHFVDGANFNASMFDKGLWCIDDASPGTDKKVHDVFSVKVKAIVANPSHPYDQKFGYKGSCPFDGRLIVTLNDDPLSLNILPDTDHSLLDKTIFLRTSATLPDVKGSEDELLATIERELPAFIRWVLDHDAPSWIKRDARFGIKAWQDPELLREARANTTSATVIEAIDMWRALYRQNGSSFAPEPAEREETEWVGTVSELYTQISAHDRLRPLLGGMRPNTLGKHINQAIANGCTWLTRSRGKDSKADRLVTVKLKDEDRLARAA